MKILAIKTKLYAPWVHSLKEKRVIVKSILGKLKNKFNVSVSEIEAEQAQAKLNEIYRFGLDIE